MNRRRRQQGFIQHTIFDQETLKLSPLDDSYLDTKNETFRDALGVTKNGREGDSAFVLYLLSSD